MKNKKIVISLVISVIILIATIGNVNAAGHTFSFTVSQTQITAKAGDTISVNLGVADIDQESDGINAIQGKMIYDEELFESVNIVRIDSSDWKITLNKEEGNPLKGKFIMDTMRDVKESETVAVLEAKIKSDASVTTGTIKLQDVFTSYGLIETAKISKTITVNIQSEEKEDEPVVPEGDKDNSGSITQEPESENKKPETQTPEEQKPENKKPETQTPDKNISKAPSLPKAGSSSWIFVGIVVVAIGSVIGYIRYKKLY